MPIGCYVENYTEDPTNGSYYGQSRTDAFTVNAWITDLSNPNRDFRSTGASKTRLCYDNGVTVSCTNIGRWVNATKVNNPTNVPAQCLTPQPPGPPVLNAVTCNVNINTGVTTATLSYSAPGANTYVIGVDMTSNNTNPVVNFGDWYKSGPPIDDWKGPADNYASTTYTTAVTPGELYNWWIHGVNNAGVGPATASSFSCSASTFQVCRNSCSSNNPLPVSVAMNDNDPGQNLVACFNSAPAGSPCTVAGGDVTTSTTWSESGLPQNAATLSGVNPKVLSPIGMFATGVNTEGMSATYGTYSKNWTVSVTKYCAPGVCNTTTSSNNCAASTPYASVPSPTPGCGAVLTPCYGTRLCDFNWKEIAP